MSANCDVIVIFPIYDKFGAIRSVELTFSLTKAFYFAIAVSKDAIFDKKNTKFLQKMLT